MQFRGRRKGRSPSPNKASLLSFATLGLVMTAAVKFKRNRKNTINPSNLGQFARLGLVMNAAVKFKRNTSNAINPANSESSAASNVNPS